MLRVFLSLKDSHNDVLPLLDGHQVDVHNGTGSFQQKIATGNYHLVLSDADASMVPSIKLADPRVEVILIGNHRDDGVEAIREGAWAHFSTPLDLDRLKATIEEIVDMFEIRSETARLEEQLDSKYTFAGIVARNPKMLEICSFIRRIAPYFKMVTIMGETGTGKEVVARAIHSLSAKQKDPLLVCNCGGFVETLIESELFGHKQGSFTGAIKDKVGLFEAAGEGALFMDEIGELPLSFQPHLLRVLQNGEFRPVGSSQAIFSKCRVIAATSKNLSHEMKNGKFREDLFYRITPLTITIPPLRERKDDIPLLSRFFLNKSNAATGKKIVGISRSAQAVLMSHDWPGNVRELENVIEQAVILAPESFIKVEHLPGYLQEAGIRHHASDTSLADVIRKHLEATLSVCDGNKSETARRLGLSRRALLRWIEKYNIAP
ncbi:MAG TPA: sigma-54 dependent transcriptional regulator [Syntrophorhabdales bacterium]|nr:sigma-54 dependent transcriptional regulator [Syntrophorhabdales bacterium]